MKSTGFKPAAFTSIRISPRPGSGTGTQAGTGSGSGPGAGRGSGPGNGITISGGAGTGRGAHGVAPRNPQRGYGLTIISGGSSGGASRDLGVFGRSETVYTVYISMADAGGGPDWPMQYSLAGSSPPGNGLLTPPFTQVKVRATMPPATNTFGSSNTTDQVFVTAIIDDRGVMQAMRALRQPDAKAKAALDALRQWKFTAGMVSGTPVATKVLIGVTLMPALEVAPQQP